MSDKKNNEAQEFEQLSKDIFINKLNEKIPVINVGFDYGHSFIKAARVDYNKVNDNGKFDLIKVSFPTVFKSTKAPTIKQAHSLKHIVFFENECYAVGDRAVRAEATRKWDKNQSLIKNDFCLVLGTALVELTKNLDADEININLSLGLPIDYLINQEDRLKKMLHNLSFNITVNGVTKKFNIIDNFITQQGVGAFYAYTIDAYGKINSENYESLRETNGVAMIMIDYGYKTADYLTIVYSADEDVFSIFDEKSGSTEKGLFNAHQQVYLKLNTEFDLTKDLLFFEDVYIKNNGIMVLGNDKIDINEFFEEEYKKLSNSIIDELRKIIDFKMSPKTILTGGSASKMKTFFNDYLDNQINVYVQEDSFWANVLGYLGKYNMDQIIKNI